MTDPAAALATLRDDKGYSEETCVRCGWRMGSPPLNCQNDNTPHRFPSQEDELARLRDQVKFCPYCAGAFVPETKGYEGPCAGCKRAEAAEARCAQLQQALERISKGYHLEDHDYTGACNGRCAQKIAREALAGLDA